MQYIDLTKLMTPNMEIFPGDPPFICHPCKSLEAGDPYNLYHLSFSNHIGTHIDFPSHVIKNGKNSSDFAISRLIGNGIIIEIAEQFNSINVNSFCLDSIKSGDFVFFKTKHSNKKQENIFLELEAAQVLQQKGVTILGTDSISIDKYEDMNLPIHHYLLSNNILIVENLNLSDVVSGRFKFYIFPLNVPMIDGLPVRVVAEVR